MEDTTVSLVEDGISLFFEGIGNLFGNPTMDNQKLFDFKLSEQISKFFQDKENYGEISLSELTDKGLNLEQVEVQGNLTNFNELAQKNELNYSVLHDAEKDVTFLTFQKKDIEKVNDTFKDYINEKLKEKDKSIDNRIEDKQKIINEQDKSKEKEIDKSKSQSVER